MSCGPTVPWSWPVSDAAARLRRHDPRCGVGPDRRPAGHRPSDAGRRPVGRSLVPDGSAGVAERPNPRTGLSTTLPPPRLVGEATGWVSALALSPDGMRLATGRARRADLDGGTGTGDDHGPPATLRLPCPRAGVGIDWAPTAGVFAVCGTTFWSWWGPRKAGAATVRVTRPIWRWPGLRRNGWPPRRTTKSGVGAEPAPGPPRVHHTQRAVVWALRLSPRTGGGSRRWRPARSPGAPTIPNPFVRPCLAGQRLWALHWSPAAPSGAAGADRVIGSGPDEPDPRECPERSRDRAHGTGSARWSGADGEAARRRRRHRGGVLRGGPTASWPPPAGAGQGRGLVTAGDRLATGPDDGACGVFRDTSDMCGRTGRHAAGGVRRLVAGLAVIASSGWTARSAWSPETGEAARPLLRVRGAGDRRALAPKARARLGRRGPNGEGGGLRLTDPAASRSPPSAIHGIAARAGRPPDRGLYRRVLDRAAWSTLDDHAARRAPDLDPDMAACLAGLGVHRTGRTRGAAGRSAEDLGYPLAGYARTRFRSWNERRRRALSAAVLCSPPGRPAAHDGGATHVLHRAQPIVTPPRPGRTHRRPPAGAVAAMNRRGLPGRRRLRVRAVDLAMAAALAGATSSPSPPAGPDTAAGPAAPRRCDPRARPHRPATPRCAAHTGGRLCRPLERPHTAGSRRPAA